MWLGFSFPSIKKWSILTAIFIVQISMNFNAAIYGNAVSGMSKEFDVTESKAKYGPDDLLGKLSLLLLDSISDAATLQLAVTPSGCPWACEVRQVLRPSCRLLHHIIEGDPG